MQTIIKAFMWTMRLGRYPSSIANLEQLLTHKAIVKEDDPSKPQGVKEHLPICDNKIKLDKGSKKLQEIKKLEDIEFEHQNKNIEPMDGELYYFLSGI